MNNASFQTVGQDPAVIFKLFETAKDVPEVDQEPITNFSQETIKAGSQGKLLFSAKTEEVEASGVAEPDTNLPPVEDHLEVQVIIPPKQNENLFAQYQGNPFPEREPVKGAPAKGADCEQKAKLEGEVEELQKSLLTVKTETYRKIEVLLSTPPKEYSVHTLNEIISVSRDFSPICDFVAKNAIAVVALLAQPPSYVVNSLSWKVLRATKQTVLF